MNLTPIVPRGTDEIREARVARLTNLQIDETEPLAADFAVAQQRLREELQRLGTEYAAADRARLTGIETQSAREREQNKRRLDAIEQRRSAVIDRMAALNERIRRVQSPAELEWQARMKPIAVAIYADMQTHVTAANQAAIALVAALAALRKLGLQAEDQLSDDYGRYRGDRLGLPQAAIGFAGGGSAISNLDADMLAFWQREARELFRL